MKAKQFLQIKDKFKQTLSPLLRKHTDTHTHKIKTSRVVFRVHQVRSSLGKVCINKLRSGILTGGLSKAKKHVWDVVKYRERSEGEQTDVDKIECEQRSKYTDTRGRRRAGSKRVRRFW